MKEFYNPNEIAEMLGIKPRQVVKQAKMGRLPFSKNGNRYRVPVKAWEAYLEAQVVVAMASLKMEENDAHTA